MRGPIHSRKDLSPKQWKLLARHFYEKRAKERGAKLTNKNWKRVQSGFIYDYALEQKYGKLHRAGTYAAMIQHTFWWSYDDAFFEAITKDFILAPLLGEKDLAPSPFCFNSFRSLKK